MIIKPGKRSDDVKSYRSISLLPITSKVMELLLLKELTSIVEAQRLNIAPLNKFIVDVLNAAFEEKKYCTAVF